MNSRYDQVSFGNVINGEVSTYTLTAPLLNIEKDVVTTFSTITQRLRHHLRVFGEPNLQLLVVAPVSLMP